MFYAGLTLHILVAVLLVLIVLLQSGRGAELGAAFGGTGQATYGRGQSTFISKVTTGIAVIFMATSLTLAFMTTERPTSSVLPARRTAPAQPRQQQPATAPQAPATQAPAVQTEAPPQPNPSPPENR
ncbi:MAG: preprotein translocase subunit SecG [bacterium]